MSTVIVLLMTAYCLFQTTSFQTWITQRIAVILSDEIKTKVAIGHVDIEFIKTIVLDDVYIEDLRQDTFLYVKRLKVDIANFDYKKQELYISDISLTTSTVNLEKHKEDKRWNYKLLIDALSGPKDTTDTDTTGGWNVVLDKISIHDMTLIYANRHYNDSSRGINFDDMRVTNIKAQISHIETQEDTIFAKVDYASAREKSGFELSQFSCFMKVSPVGIRLKEVTIRTPESYIATNSLGFRYKNYDEFTDDFITKVRMRGKFEKTKIEMSDIAYFAPELKGIYKTITFSGEVSGRVNELKAKKLDIHFGDETRFTGDVDLKGLPDIDQTFIQLNVEKLITSKRDMEQIPVPPFQEQKTIHLPANFALLGKVKFKGNFSGFINDFVAYGDFNTAIGQLSSDISMVQGEKDELTRFNGKVKSNDFDIGKFIGLENVMGKITINASVKGKGLTRDQIVADIKGTVNAFELNKYNYKNINVEGTIAKNVFKGILGIKEDNIHMDFDGDVDFSKKLPRLDFASTIYIADMRALNFVTSEKSTLLGTKMHVNITGNDIDNLIGSIKLENTSYTRGMEIYRMNNFDLDISEAGGVKTVKLASDIADGRISGKFNIGELGNSVQTIVEHYIPAIARRDPKELKPQEFEYSVKVKQPDPITKLFFPEFKLAGGGGVYGKYNSTNNALKLKASVPKLEISGNVFSYIAAEVVTDNSSLSLGTRCDKLLLSDSIWLKYFNVNAKVANSKVDWNINWDNKSAPDYRGDVNGSLVIQDKRHMNAKVTESNIVLGDSIWILDSANEITIDSNAVQVKSLTFTNFKQTVKVEGVISENKRDQLLLFLDNFNLANVNPLTRRNGLQLRGSVSGTTSFADLYHKIFFTSSNDFSGLVVNNELIGSGSVNSIYDKQQDVINLNGSFSRDTTGGGPAIKNIQFVGAYYPNKTEENIVMDLSLQTIRLEMLQPYLKDYCSEVKGKLSGNASIRGSIEKPTITGRLQVKADKWKVDYLNTVYSFDTEVLIEPNSFGVEGMRVFDSGKNLAVVNGKVHHDNFKKFQLDIDMEAKKFMFLNTTEAQNGLYYGKAYASGIINVFGYLDKVIIDIAVKTEKGTQFNIPLSGPAEVSESDFITFVKKDTSKVKEDDYMVNLKGIELNFDLEATPDAEIKLIFDSKIGDVIKGRGAGNIKMGINTAGNFNIFGDFNITSGDYLFTLKNVINKHFDIERGGVVKWSGDPYDADINLVASYKPRASLKPFFPYDSSGTYKKRYQVDCRLLMTGKLMSPDINFEIELPNVDENTRQIVKGYINNPQEVNKQVFSLLVLNSFLPPPQFAENEKGDAVSANSSELLSTQLSNWLSQISKDFDIGVNYRPGDQISNQEVAVALSTQLFNDKVSVETNFGYSDNNTSSSTQGTSNIVGDVNVEYKLTDDGKVKLKAFNKTNNNQITTNGPYTQGVGVAYKEEFDTFGQLYRRYLSRVKKPKGNT